MFLKLLLILPAFLIYFPSVVFANEPPQLSSPSDGSTVSSSALNWQAPSYQLYSSSPYMIQVDDDPNFSPSEDIYRNNIYKTTTTYTPELYSGTWFWRVKAKDSTGTWSDWSSAWSFTLTASTPQPTSSSTPTPTPTSSPSPTPSSSSSSTSSGSSSSSIFTISGVPSEINSSDSFTVSIYLSLPNNPNSDFYLKAAFKKPDGSNYFGLTKVSGAWVKNGSSYSSQYKITTDASGNWTGNLEVKPDNEDSGFTGTDDYIFKVGRYTSSGSGPSWSNENSIKITGVSISESSEPTSTRTPIKSGPTPSSATPAPAKKTAVNTSVVKLSPKVASVAGEATISAGNFPSPSTTVEVKGNKINFLPWIGAGFILAGIMSLGFIYYRSRKNEKIYHPL